MQSTKMVTFLGGLAIASNIAGAMVVAWFLVLVVVGPCVACYMLSYVNYDLHDKMARERIARLAGSVDAYDFFMGSFRNITRHRDFERHRTVYEKGLPKRTDGSSGGSVEITMTPTVEPCAGTSTEHMMSIWLNDVEVEPGVTPRAAGPYDMQCLSVISGTAWTPARHPHCTWAPRHDGGPCEQCIQRELVQKAFVDILAVEAFVAALENDAHRALRTWGGIVVMAHDSRNSDHLVLRRTTTARR
jgi:hypothetical protein